MFGTDSDDGVEVSWEVHFVDQEGHEDPDDVLFHEDTAELVYRDGGETTTFWVPWHRIEFVRKFEPTGSGGRTL